MSITSVNMKYVKSKHMRYISACSVYWILDQHIVYMSVKIWISNYICSIHLKVIEHHCNFHIRRCSNFKSISTESLWKLWHACVIMVIDAHTPFFQVVFAPIKFLALATTKIYILHMAASLAANLHSNHCGLVTPYGDRDLGQHWLG